MKQKLILCAVIALACGCASQQVPKSKIAFDLHAGTGSLSLPKDADVTGLNVSVGTNGMVQVHVDHLSVKMNADVVTAAGESFSKGVSAGGDVAAKGFAAGIQAAGKSVVPVP